MAGLAALPSSFYERHTVAVAKNLVGKLLVVSQGGGEAIVARIVEVEAYREGDPAAHCANGPTPRCAIMFGPAGCAYVYQLHRQHLLNLITEPNGTPGGVLVRVVEPVAGIDIMQARRKCDRHRELCNGPGKLCQALGIDMRYNGMSLQGPELFVADDGFVPTYTTTKRIGISKGIDLPWRFVVESPRQATAKPRTKLPRLTTP